jgi:3-phosphoshikimate 1-carboxyvinyltransferase
MDKIVSSVQSLRGTVFTPPDKSIAQRAALFSLLSDRESIIRNYPFAKDPQSALNCIRELGAVVVESNGEVRITGPGKNGFPVEAGTIDCGNSGTVMRLLTGILAGAGTGATLTGDDSLSARTMKRITDPLISMGAVIEAREGMYAPLTLKSGHALKGIQFVLPVASAQLKSCILLAGLFTEGTTVIESIQSRNHTEQMLGLKVDKMGGTNTIFSSDRQKLPALSMTIPGDFSSAAFWLVAGSVYPESEILIRNTGLNPTRTTALDILKRMGVSLETWKVASDEPEPMGDIRIRTARLKSTEIQPDEIPGCIDEIPILAVAMAFAEGVSVFRGAAELRHKECDRIEAMSRILQAAGVKVKEFQDGLEITGDPGFQPLPARYESRHDHRIAMASAILAGRGTGESTILNAEAAEVSYTEFWKDFHNLSA